MQQLHFVGFTTDHKGLVFSARKGSRAGGYVLPVDQQLLGEIEELIRLRNGRSNGSGPAPGEPSVESVAALSARPESQLTPRAIQARLRAGHTLAEVAAEAGVGEDWIARFAAPILAEQARIIEQAGRLPSAKPRLGPSSQPLATSVRWNLIERGVILPDEEFNQAWGAYQRTDGVWVVQLSYLARNREQAAEWLVDLTARTLTPLNRQASDLGFVEAGRRPPEDGLPPAPAERPVLGATATPSQVSRSAAALPLGMDQDEADREPESEPDREPEPEPAASVAVQEDGADMADAPDRPEPAVERPPKATAGRSRKPVKPPAVAGQAAEAAPPAPEPEQPAVEATVSAPADGEVQSADPVEPPPVRGKRGGARRRPGATPTPRPAEAPTSGPETPWWSPTGTSMASEDPAATPSSPPPAEAAEVEAMPKRRVRRSVPRAESEVSLFAPEPDVASTPDFLQRDVAPQPEAESHDGRPAVEPEAPLDDLPAWAKLSVEAFADAGDRQSEPEMPPDTETSDRALGDALAIDLSEPVDPSANGHHAEGSENSGNGLEPAVRRGRSRRIRTTRDPASGVRNPPSNGTQPIVDAAPPDDEAADVEPPPPSDSQAGAERRARFPRFRRRPS